ncbi:MAG: pre-mycofactocin synthase MftD [Rhodococcus sp. (in: high G+C Gram-positive bacteria)]
MSSTRWFESVAEAQRRAQRCLPTSVYNALVAGSERGITRDDNTAAFRELGFAPHVADLADVRDLSTTFMGQPLSFPVMISPTGVQAVHPDGEVAVARAAACRGVSMGLSLFASKSVEEVAAVNSQTFFQLHWAGSRELLLHMVGRARAAGAVGLILTMDWSFSEGRDWGSPSIPERVDVRTMISHAPEAITHPRWLGRFVGSGRLPTLTAPNLTPPEGAAPSFFGAYREWKSTPLPTWDDIAWLRAQWDGPFMLKGITRVDDAERAADVGATAISVSNHGGNNLDGTPASIRALPAIVDAVGDRVEVALDGGIRRGSDVVKALALGAHAVLIGRAYLWGLAANGQAGVENVLDILRGGVDSAVLGLGHSSVRELSASDIVVPPGFGRVLGAREPSTSATRHDLEPADRPNWDSSPV